jgi:F-type H+-transporting ATPase subunit a
MASLHISISAEPIFTIGAFTVTNSIFTTWLVSAGLIAFVLWYHHQLKQVSPKRKPGHFQVLIESLIMAFERFITGITGDAKKTATFFPLITTFFIFILLSNWSGLLPGVGTIGVTGTQAYEGFIPLLRAPTADINTTLALALFSVISIQVIGYRFLSLGYFKKFINFSGPIQFVVGILEILSEISRIISFAFRLFGNIFAGEVLLVVIAFLIPLVLPIPFYGLEVFVGLIQALVFSLLTLVFLNIATMAHEENH